MVFLDTIHIPFMAILDTIELPLMVILDTIEFSLMAILDTIEFSSMAILDIIHPTMCGILDTMVRSYTKIWPSVDGIINDLKYGIKDNTASALTRYARYCLINGPVIEACWRVR